MRDKEILEKAIRKAVDNGWSGTVASQISGIAEEDIDLLFDSDTLSAELRNAYGYSVWSFIFNHDFAKALWGDKTHHWFATGYPTESSDGNLSEEDIQFDEWGGLTNWQHHLQQMVIADDPIKYLGDNLPV